MANEFRNALAFALGNEGGYCNIKGDRGGATNMGVTASTLARARAQGIVRQHDVMRLTRAEAEKIYKYLYWIPSRADELPEPLCVIYFDCVINHGLGGGGKLLQKAINNLSQNVKLKTDGAVGTFTMAAFRGLMAGNSEVAEELLKERERKYASIIAANPTQKKFERGWGNRVARCRQYIKRYGEGVRNG